MTDCDATPLAERRRAGIEKLRSMSHYGECRALAANTARALDAYSCGLAATLPSSPSVASHQPAREAIVLEKPSRIFSGLTVDSMSNMLSRNNETGHQPFHLTLFRLSEPASWFITLMWSTLIPIYGFCFSVECSGYT